MKRWAKLTTVALVAALALSACGTTGGMGTSGIRPPTAEAATPSGERLRALAPPARRIDVAVYGFADQTGQHKPNEFFAEFSRAVTQGGDAVLIDVLKGVSGGRWFNPVERVGLQNLLTERNLIEQSHRAYRGTQSSPLPPLRFAGVILEGGIINYDSNVETGGAGARLLGIGASTQHRRDMVTVFLRAVSVNTGEILTSVTASKTIYSTLVQGSVFRFVATDEILEAEAGVSRNEPVGLAVRQAIELAVYRLVHEGAKNGLWRFANPGTQTRMIADYNRRMAQHRGRLASGS